MKLDVNTKARVAFVMCLLLSGAGGATWYFRIAGRYVNYQIYTQDSVSGLVADAPIEFHGVEVGKVNSIRLLNPHSVGIVLSIDKAAPVTSATVVTITSRGLATRGFTGYVYISLDDVGADPRPLITSPGKPYPVIATAPSKSVTVDTTINQVAQNVQIITTLLQSLLDKRTIESLQQSIDSLQQLSKGLVNNTAKLNTIVANTDRASRRFDPLLQASQDTVRALQTQILPEAQKALTNLDDLSNSFTGIAAKIDRDPSILLRGAPQPQPGPGEKQ